MAQKEQMITMTRWGFYVVWLVLQEIVVQVKVITTMKNALNVLFLHGVLYDMRSS